MKRLVLFFATLALAFTFTSAPAIAQEVQIAGEWHGEWRALPHYIGRIQLKLFKDGDAVRGTVSTDGMVQRPMINEEIRGSLKDGQLDLVMPGIAYSFLKATVSNDKMEGQVKAFGAWPADFFATKQK